MTFCAVALLTASAFTTHTRLQRTVASQRRHRGSSRVQATMILGGGEDDDKPKLTRETEPDQYFASNFESLSAQDKLKDPLVIIGLVSIFFPFVLLIVFNNMGLLGN